MNQVLWQLPVPSASINGADFEVLPRRRCEISCYYEDEQGQDKQASILFDGVEAYKTTYLTSLASIDWKLRRQAHDTLLALDQSPWLDEIKKAHADYDKERQTQPKELRHFVIYFDDGPFFELICTDYKITSA